MYHGWAKQRSAATNHVVGHFARPLTLHNNHLQSSQLLPHAHEPDGLPSLCEGMSPFLLFRRDSRLAYTRAQIRGRILKMFGYHSKLPKNLYFTRGVDCANYIIYDYQKKCSTDQARREGGQGGQNLWGPATLACFLDFTKKFANPSYIRGLMH